MSPSRGPLGLNPFASWCMLLAAASCVDGDTVSLAEPAHDRPITLVEDLRIEGLESDLVRIGALIVRDDGSIAITQQQDGAIRYFDRNGSPLGSFGSRGEGPGEFMVFSAVGLIEDTVWAYDGRLDRITLITPARELSRIIPVRVRSAHPSEAESTRLPAFASIFVRGLHADGSFHSVAYQPAGPSASLYQDGQSFLRVAQDGAILDLVGYAPPGTGSFHTTVGGGAGGAFPFPIAPHSEISRDGGRIAIVMAAAEGDDAGSYGVVMLSNAGDTIYSRRYPFDGVPIPDAVRDSAIEAGFASWNERMPEIAKEYRRQAHVPPVYPPIEGIVVGRDGTLWIRMRTTDLGRPYRIVDPAGQPIGTAHVPASVRLMEADRSQAWAVETDDLGVQSVVRYRVSEAAAAAAR